MRICILTQRLYINYGGILQAYALQTVLKRMGHEVVTDRDKAKYPISLIGKLSRFGYNLYKRYIVGDKSCNPYLYFFKFCGKYCKISPTPDSVYLAKFIQDHICTINLFEGYPTPHNEIVNEFDVFIVGSDQVWRPTYSYVPTYFLEFTKDMPVKRIAYAASFGVDHCDEYEPEILRRCRISAKRFDAISVREDSGVKLCRDFLGVDAIHLLDPTMLLEKKDYLMLIEEADKNISENLLMCYILDNNPKVSNIVQILAEKLGLIPLEIIPHHDSTIGLKNNLRKELPSISTWLAGFRDAKFIITDSFHGTVFSIIFNKPFLVIANSKRGLTRFSSLLRIFDLEDRVITNMDDICWDDYLSNINYEKVNHIWSIWKSKSMNFLASNI